MGCPTDNNRMVMVTVYNTAKSATFQVHHKDCRDNKKEKETANNSWDEVVGLGVTVTGEKFPTAKMLAMALNRENDFEGDNQYTEEDFKLHNCVHNK